MSVEDIYMHYDTIGVNNDTNNLLNVYTKGAATRVSKQKAQAAAQCEKWIQYMIDAREKLVNSVFKYTDDNGVKLPVSFQNIINNIQGSLGLGGNSVVDITPYEFFSLVDEFRKNQDDSLCPTSRIDESDVLLLPESPRLVMYQTFPPQSIDYVVGDDCVEI
jgi:hypothetical protein